MADSRKETGVHKQDTPAALRDQTGYPKCVVANMAAPRRLAWGGQRDVIVKENPDWKDLSAEWGKPIEPFHKEELERDER